MCRAFWRLSVAVALLTGAELTEASSELVVSMRYLQPVGISHAHLFLYRGDGRLLRQLTKDDVDQDRNPIFSPDGSEIVFVRERRNNPTEYWSIESRGDGLHRLTKAPEWYGIAKTSPCFDIQSSTIRSTDVLSSATPAPASATQDAAHLLSPDGAFEIVFQRAPDLGDDNEDDYDQPGHGRHYLLRNVKTGRETEFGKMPGYLGASHLLTLGEDRRAFLIADPLRVVFFGLHLNSTDGDTVFALDLTGPRFVRLSPNWAAPFPLPGEPAFLTYAENRYMPIPGSHKTANCSYIERWDARLQKIRYARPGTAAICYGACLYQQGVNSARVIVLTNRNGN